MSEPRTPYQITGNDPRGYDKHGSERGARTAPRDKNRAAAVLLHMAGVEPLPTPPTAAERLNALDMGAEALRHYIDPKKRSNRKMLNADDVIGWLAANIIDFEYYVKRFKQDFGL